MTFHGQRSLREWVAHPNDCFNRTAPIGNLEDILPKIVIIQNGRRKNFGHGTVNQHISTRFTKAKWHRNEGHHRSLSMALAAILILPCSAALLNDHGWTEATRALSGVVSTSAGLSLVPLQTETGYDDLRIGVRVLWALTYGVFLMLSYRGITRNGPLYLFCSLLLAVHFTVGFVGAASTVTESVFTYGPLAATACAALVYIPFIHRERSSGSMPDQEMCISRQNEHGSEDGRAVSLPTECPVDDDGDLGVHVMTGILGLVT